MKSRNGCTQLNIPSYDGSGRKGFSSRHSQLLPGMIVLFIVCWMITSIWLINARRSERSLDDVSARKGTVALILTEEMQTNR